VGLAGRLVGLPVHGVLGTSRTRVPTYASTIDGAVKGPLATPESFARRACKRQGMAQNQEIVWREGSTPVGDAKMGGPLCGGPPILDNC
jgi:L-alanine-DL-glutamate epimerase-like enolase superfamily enzyme